MNFTVNEMTKSITGKSSLDECSVEELQQLTNSYPYFAPAQFLLLKRLKITNSPLLASHIEKSSIYFKDPVWLDLLINDNNPVFVQKKEGSFSVPATEKQAPAMQEKVVTHHEEDDDEMIVAEEETYHGQQELQIPKLKIEAIDPSKAELLFEPYHTVDYFASQGIQPKEDDKPKDQFSRQLKSFTEWLKVMKRLQTSNINATVSATDEIKVEKMAEVSINDRDVVTETMAEVWEKQGNTVKAIEIYKKLSLLNPDKSSYFAAKIEQLKNL